MEQVNEDIKAIGQLTIEKLDGLTGETTTIVVPNMIVTMGKEYIAGRLLQTAQLPMTHMGIGYGTTAVNVTQTALVNEVLAAEYNNGTTRPALDGSFNPAKTGAVLTYKCTFGTSTSGATRALTEAAIFDSATIGSGNMLARTVFGVVTKTKNDTITISWQISIA